MRMIERWFPCAEVSEATEEGWGSAKSEKALFVWFATRPLAQAKAAVLTSLIPWPESIEEQQRLQDLVRQSLTGYDACHDQVVQAITAAHPQGALVVDPFSGRGVVPLEAARMGVRAWGLDLSPTATLAGTLLADYPVRDWSAEPPIGLKTATAGQEVFPDRLTEDVRAFLDEVGLRYEGAMRRFYPAVGGVRPWGYLWAATLPCQECGRRFPLTGSLVLRHPLRSKDDPGQSYRIVVDQDSGNFRAVVHDGAPQGDPTLVNLRRGAESVRGKVAICPFCGHPHAKEVHTRLAAGGHFEDVLLLAAEADEGGRKRFRSVTDTELADARLAEAALVKEPPFGPGLPAVPNERIPAGNHNTVRASVYGAQSYGDLCNPRQTLGFVKLARCINDVAAQVLQAGTTPDYAAALAGYAGSVLVRKLKYATHGATLQTMLYPTSNRVAVKHVFTNEASISFSYDYFETGLGNGPGTWTSLSMDTLAVLRNQFKRARGRPASIRRGSALALPLRDQTASAVVTDPPYDDMIDYADASDLFYVWLKRALVTTHPEFVVTSDQYGLQEKTDEIIVKRGWATNADHRSPDNYDKRLAEAFREAARVVRPDGVVTIVFGHGDPEVWRRLLGILSAAQLVLTGSWPARTESGGRAGSANIVTTLTLSCRPASADRPTGDMNVVDQLVRRAVKERVPLWERAGLAHPDQLMASAGPAMEVVGRFSQVLDRRGEPVGPSRFLLVARRAVEEAAAIKVEDVPIETFDARTHFALYWSRLYGRGLAPKSEARWQALAYDLSTDALQGVLVEAENGKGVRLAYARESQPTLGHGTPLIDVAFALAEAWPSGFGAVGEVLAQAGRDVDDHHLWAAIAFLSARLPEADVDGLAWTGLTRARHTLAPVAREAVAAIRRAEDAKPRQWRLFEDAPVHQGER